MIRKHDYGAVNYYEESFNLLFNQVKDCLLIFDYKGTIIRMNKTFLTKLNYTQEKINGTNLTGLLPQNDEVREIMQGVLKGKISKYSIPFYSKTGKLLYLETRVFQGRWEGKDVLYSIGKEVPDIKRGEQKLEVIRSILDSLPFLAWIKDKDGKYVIVNREFKNFYKIKGTEVIGKTGFDILAYDTALKYRKSEEELIKSREKFLKTFDYKVAGKWLEGFVMRYYDKGEVQGTLGIARSIIKRKRLEIELANKEKFLKIILDTIPDYIFYKNTFSTYLGSNKAFAEKGLGISESEVNGKTDFDFVGDIKLAKSRRRKDRKALLNGKIKYEDRYVLKDGSIINTEVEKIPFINERGKVIGLIGIARDITGRKRLEKLLREKAKYAELLFKTVPSAVLSVDKHWKIIRWNKIAEEITGYSAAEVIGQDCSKILYGIDIKNCKFCLNALDSPVINQNCIILAKDGQIRHVLKSIAVVKDEFDRIKEITVCFGDITEMINMREELRESKERYAAMVNNAPQIVFIFKEGIIEFMNDTGIEVLGYKDKYFGCKLKDFITKDSFERLNTALIKAQKVGDCVTCEIELIKKNGEIINVLFKGTEIIFEQETAFLSVMMDITEKKKLNAKLQASEEKFRQLAETIDEIFLIIDQDRIVYVSPAYKRICGVSCQSLLEYQNIFAGLIHPADREKIYASLFHNSKNMNEVVNEEFRIIRPDGGIRWLWLQSYPIRDKKNNNSNSLLKASIMVDITARKKMEEQLRERERQTRLELSLAARVQQNFLPDPFLGDKVRIETIFEPHSTVSGDIFNFKWFEEQEKLRGYIIDVSGHGVGTALQTATFKMMLDVVLLDKETINENDIKTINKKIIPYLYEDSFIALLYFEFDFKTKVLKLISAGITLFLVADSRECSLVPISGCYLGILDDPIIETTTRPFKEGEIFCLMSDGVSDLIELYGTSKRENFAEYMNWLEKLSKCPECSDDFTVIGIEIFGKDKERTLRIKNNEDLEKARGIIGEFLVRNASLDAPMLEVAVNEALNNAFNACGQACVKLRRVGRKLIIRVKDNGQGFNTSKVKALLKREKNEHEFDELVDAESGRGILMMKMICDRVIYNAKGNEVLMMKKI